MKTIVIGAGGHARVVSSILQYDANIELVGFIDIVIKVPGETIHGKPVLGDHSLLPKLLKEGIRGAIIAVGDNAIREGHFRKLREMGFEMMNAVHPSASVANDVVIGRGVVIAAGAVICTHATIGDNTVINTGAIVEHENIIGENVHIAPGVNVAGRTVIKRNTFIGIGSTVKDSITIGENVTVGARAVVLENIPDNAVAVGVPAKVVKYKTV